MSATSIRPLTVVSLADEALAAIVQAITSGEFKPGDRLSEADLARKLGISRGPLREALGRLENRLVVRTPRIGFSVIALTESDLAELLALREALEGMAARLAAQVITKDEVQGLRDLLRREHGGNGDLAQRQYLDRAHDDQFHFRIAECARNQRIQDMLRRSVYYQLQLYRFNGIARRGGAPEALAEHTRIVDALAAHDSDAAEIHMRAHLRSAAICYATPTESDSPSRYAENSWLATVREP